MLGKSIIAGMAVVSMVAIAGCGGGSFGFIPEDNTDPVIAISGIVDGDQYGTLVAGPDTPHITGVAADESGIASFTLRIDGALAASSNDPNLDYDWNAVAAGNGVHELKFEATDDNGNTSEEVLHSQVVNLIIFPFP
jgi:hypothetical protein